MQENSGQRELLRQLLGEWPSAVDAPIGVKTVDSRNIQDGYRLEELRLDLNGMEEVPAFFATPSAIGNAPRPTMIFNHSHGGRYDWGKKELLYGNSYMRGRPYIEEFTSRQWNVAVIDHWCFGERHDKSESETFKDFYWHGRSLWGMMVFDSLRLLHYLRSRPDVDNDRIGTIGMSMGSTMAWWLAAMDPHIRVCVDICCLTDWDTLLAQRELDRHGLYYYVPGLLKHFSTASLNALIAPRPHLAVAGRNDPLTPLAGLKKIDHELRKAYALSGQSAHWQLALYDAGHDETAAMRARIMNFLEQYL